MTAEIGLPACRAVLAFVEDRHDDVIAELMPIRRILNRFGGSHAQRDALHRTLLESALRSGRYELARALTSERLGDTRVERVLHGQRAQRSAALATGLPLTTRLAEPASIGPVRQADTDQRQVAVVS